MNKLLPLSMLSVFLVACASSNTVEMGSRDPIRYIDLISGSQNGSVDDYWITVKTQEPIYPIRAAKNGVSGCVTFIVGINKDGKTEGYRVNKSYPEGVFDKHAAIALNDWQWVATDKNSEHAPVLTTIQLVFTLDGAKNKPEADKECGLNHT